MTILDLGSSCDLKKDINSFRKFKVMIFELTDDLPLAILMRMVRIWSIVSELRITSSLPSLNFYTISFSKFFRHSSALVFSAFSLSPSMNSRSSRMSGRYCSRSMLGISLRTLIHLMRNCLMTGFMLLNLDLRIIMNYLMLNSYWLSELRRAELRAVCRAESRNLAALRVSSSRSVILPMMLSKILLNILRIFYSRAWQMKYRDLRAVYLTLCSCSFRVYRMMLTMGSANLSMASALAALMPKVMEVSASRPDFFLLKSPTEMYFSLKKVMNFSICA